MSSVAEVFQPAIEAGAVPGQMLDDFNATHREFQETKERALRLNAIVEEFSPEQSAGLLVDFWMGEVASWRDQGLSDAEIDAEIATIPRLPGYGQALLHKHSYIELPGVRQHATCAVDFPAKNSMGEAEQSFAAHGYFSVGTSSVPDFDFGWISTNAPGDNADITISAQDERYSASGSSGGSAAAVASGAVPAAQATDGGGSGNLPGAASNIPFFKPEARETDSWGGLAQYGMYVKGGVKENVIAGLVHDAILASRKTETPLRPTQIVALEQDIRQEIETAYERRDELINKIAELRDPLLGPDSYDDVSLRGLARVTAFVKRESDIDDDGVTVVEHGDAFANEDRRISFVAAYLKVSSFDVFNDIREALGRKLTRQERVHEMAIPAAAGARIGELIEEHDRDAANTELSAGAAEIHQATFGSGADVAITPGPKPVTIERAEELRANPSRESRILRWLPDFVATRLGPRIDNALESIAQEKEQPVFTTRNGTNHAGFNILGSASILVPTQMADEKTGLAQTVRVLAPAPTFRSGVEYLDNPDTHIPERALKTIVTAMMIESMSAEEALAASAPVI